MEQSTFGIRLGYLRWLRHLIDGAAPAWADIGRAINYTGEGVSKWQVNETPPVDYTVHRPLAAFFDLKDDRWLIHNEGDPPQPDLWKIWLRYRRADPKMVPAGAAKNITEAARSAKKNAKQKKA